MDVQVTIKISRESLAEAAEVFYEVFKKEIEAGVGRPTASAAPQPPVPQRPITPAAPVFQTSISMPPQAQSSMPAGQPQSYSEQIAQKTQLPVQAMTGAPVPVQTPPTTAVAQEYTQSQVAVALSGLIDAGKKETALQILGMFGAQALTQIPKERYPELVLKLREAGANI